MSIVPRRRKRAAPDDLYRTCQITGNCPPDVVNKIENRTIADNILKYGSSIVYFGGLGIGTGRGSGGASGYKPLAGETGGVRVGGPGVIRPPTTVVDAVGPGDFVAVGATDSSVVTLAPDPTDIAVPDLEGAIELTPLDRDVVTERPGDTAVIDVQNEPSPPRAKVSRTHFLNPAFNVLSSTPLGGESSAADSVLVFGVNDGVSVGSVEGAPLLELDEIPLRHTFEIEEAPRESTPIADRVLQRATQAFRSLYYRGTEQIEVDADEFLSRPGDLVVFGFDNPAYDPDSSLIFDVPSEPAAAPQSDFRDVARISRPLFSRLRDGLVRVSRLGTRSTVQTRSGARLAPPVHFYQDLSAIASEPGIELQVLGESSRSTGGTSRSPLLQVDMNSSDTISDIVLLDDPPPDFSDSQLVIGAGSSSRAVPIPPRQPRLYDSAPVSDVDVRSNGHYLAEVHITGSDTNPAIIVETADFISLDFYLHPSLMKRKRYKRLFL